MLLCWCLGTFVEEIAEVGGSGRRFWQKLGCCIGLVGIGFLAFFRIARFLSRSRINRSLLLYSLG